MKKQVVSAEAERILCNVPEDRLGFWFEGGVVARNICDLADELAKMSDEQFSRYANVEKNDFATWVHEIIRDEALADELRHALSVATARAVLADRVADLKACCQQAPATGAKSNGKAKSAKRPTVRKKK